MSVLLIVNPRAGAGRASRAARNLSAGLRAAGVDHELSETLRPAHAAELVHAARQRGVSTIAVVGGDGTLNEVSQAYLGEDGRPVAGPALALMPAGTGGDFARCCEIDADVPAAVERIVRGRRVALDLGVLSLRDAAGKPLHHAFVNVASLGISGAVDERVERGPKWLGGKPAFLLGTIAAALTYRNVPVEIRIDDEPWHRGPVLVVALANGQCFGGGMRIAPEASFSDGQLDVVCVGNIGRMALAGVFPKIYDGSHLHHPEVRFARGRRVEVVPLRPGPPLLVDADGQTPGFAPAAVELHPGALSLML